MKKLIYFCLAFFSITFFMSSVLISDAAFYSKKLSETEATSVLNIISANEGINAYNKAHYLFYSSTYAAAYNKKFPYLNSNSYVYSIPDNGTNYSITGSAGCMAYSNFVCKYVFGANSTSANRKYICSTAGSMTSDNVKNIIMTEAQMGEQIRINDTHSISFMAYDNFGFYYTSYDSDSNPKIYIAYTTWENFKNECNSKNKTAWLYNTNTSLNNATTITTITQGYSGCDDVITDTNAIVYGTVKKSSTQIVNQFGIRIRKTNSTYESGWSYYHAPSSNYVGTPIIKIWFNLHEELGITLTHATSYTYQLYTKIDGTEYWSPEKTFITTGAHSYGSWITTQSATCTAIGIQKCSCVCGATETKTTTALGHNYSSTWTTDVVATCTKTGSKSRHCTRCSSKTDVTIIPTTTHIFDGGTVTLNPTCTSVGVNTLKCLDCGTTCPLSIPALGHNYSSAWTTDSTPTCTVSGSKSHHCTRCSAKIGITAISATGHAWNEWKITVNATKESSGTKTRTCQNNGCTAKETVITAKLPSAGHTHSFGEWHTDKLATCTSNGVLKRTCSDCNAFESKTLSATGHNFSKWSPTKQATEFTEGILERKCANCNIKETESIPRLPQVATEMPLTPSPVPTPAITEQPSVTAPIFSNGPTTTLDATSETTTVSAELPTHNFSERNNSKANGNSTKIALIAVASAAILLLIALIVMILKRKS